MNEERLPASDVLTQRLLAHAQTPWEGKALRRAETASARFGLTLPPEALARLGEERRRVLRETRRLELGEGILPQLILAFCDSPYLTQENWEEDLTELQALFYHFKNETRDTLPDDELLCAMAWVFREQGGSLERLSQAEPEALIRAAREARHG